MRQGQKHQSILCDILRWIAFIPYGFAIFSICELTGYLYNLIADSIGLGIFGDILAYPAHLITACIGLYITFLFTLNMTPNKWLGGVIFSSFMLLMFTCSIILATIGVIQVNAFFYIELFFLIGMVVFFLVRIAPNKEELFE